MPGVVVVVVVVAEGEELAEVHEALHAICCMPSTVTMSEPRGLTETLSRGPWPDTPRRWSGSGALKTESWRRSVPPDDNVEGWGAGAGLTPLAA